MKQRVCEGTVLYLKRWQETLLHKYCKNQEKYLNTFAESKGEAVILKSVNEIMYCFLGKYLLQIPIS